MVIVFTFNLGNANIMYVSLFLQETRNMVDKSQNIEKASVGDMVFYRFLFPMS